MRTKAVLTLGVAAVALQTPFSLPTFAAAVPKIGRPCAAADAGLPVVGANRTLLECVRKNGKYSWSVARNVGPATPAATATTVAGATRAETPATTAAPAVSAPATTSAPAKNEKWPDKLVFAPVPAENASAAALSWGPFVKGLEKQLGIKVEQVSATSYAGVIEAQIAGKVDLAMYGPFSYYLARQAGAKIEPVAVAVGEIGTPASYQSFLIAKSTSPINSISDLKGRRVCFVDPASTSGYLYPYEGLKTAGIDPLKDVQATFAGGHDRSVIAVNAGTCDAGFAFDDMVNKTALDRGLYRQGDLKIVWRSKPIPQSPIAISSTLPDSLVKKIKETIPSLDALYFQANGLCPSSNQRCGIGDGSSLKAWVPVNDAFFQPIADICAATQAAACKPN